MSSQQEPAVLSRTILIGTVVAAILLLLLGLAWPIALLAGIGGFFVSRSVGSKLTDERDHSTASDAEPADVPRDEQRDVPDLERDDDT